MKNLKLKCFTAQNCTPCIIQKKKLAEIDIEIDYIQDINIAEQYNVSTVPTIILEKESNEVERFIGYTDINKIKNAINKLEDK